MFGQPVLAINDIDLVKTIKVKDFNHFVDTQNEHMSKTQLIGGDLDTLFNSHLGTAKEGEWRDIRSSFSPIFTSGRMKGMMKFLRQVGISLTEEIGQKASSGKANSDEIFHPNAGFWDIDSKQYVFKGALKQAIKNSTRNLQTH